MLVSVCLRSIEIFLFSTQLSTHSQSFAFIAVFFFFKYEPHHILFLFLSLSIPFRVRRCVMSLFYWLLVILEIALCARHRRSRKTKVRFHTPRNLLILKKSCSKGETWHHRGTSLKIVVRYALRRTPSEAKFTVAFKENLIGRQIAKKWQIEINPLF